MEFCVECGAEEKLYGHLCKRCLLSKDILTPPKHVSVTVCRSCDKVLRGSRWVETSPLDEAGKTLKRETKTRPEVTDLECEVPDFDPEKGEHRLDCNAIARIGDEVLSLPFTVAVKIKVQVCDVCSRQRGDYYEAIIQLRREGLGSKSSDQDLAEGDAAIQDLIAELGKNDRMGFISKTEKVSGGIDYYLGSTGMAKSVARRLRDSMGASITETTSLAGMKDGREQYRWTILVRLPSHKAGDVVAFEKELYAIESMNRKYLNLRHLVNGRKTRIQATTDIRSISQRENLEEAVVVSKDADTVQILDPGNMRTVTVARPPDFDEIDETVKIVRSQDEIFIVKGVRKA